MPIVSALPARTKPIAFLWDMVSGDFLASRTYASDYQASELYDTIVDKLKIPRDFQGYADSYATSVVYTQKLTFNWHPDTPPEIRGFEAVWNAILSGVDPVACFQQFQALDVTILNGAGSDPAKPGFVAGWRYAVSLGYKIWTPLETRPLEQLTEAQRNDPDFLASGLPEKRDS